MRNFARDVAENFELEQPIVEMGARAAEGQEDIADVRSLYAAGEYIGCDIQPGPGVDRIEDIHALSFTNDSVGTVLAFETLEHVADPIRAMEEVHRVLKPGGIAVVSSVMFFPIHAHPWDYWRFTPEGFDLVLRPFETRLVVPVGYELLPEAVFGLGVKGPFDHLVPERLPRTWQAHREWGSELPVDFGPIRLTTRQLWKYTLHYTRLAAMRRAQRLTGGASPPAS